MTAEALDQAICPGCAALYTKAGLQGAMQSRGYFCCTSCGYESPGGHGCLLTIREMLERDDDTAVAYQDVDLEGYTRRLLSLCGVTVTP